MRTKFRDGHGDSGDRGNGFDGREGLRRRFVFGFLCTSLDETRIGQNDPMLLYHRSGDLSTVEATWGYRIYILNCTRP
jgi:hypothetical protein